MNYCPYCGTELINGTVSFCTECGKPIPSPAFQSDKKKSTKAKRRDTQIVKPDFNEIDPDYDGYYNDIQPEDIESIRQEFDKQLVKKLALIITAVLVIVGISVVIMHYL